MATESIGGTVHVVWQARYLSFGGVEITTGANTQTDIRFPGQWFQSEHGLHQNWMRDYDPVTGRYLQADPLGLVDGASVYGYALQNPMSYTDFHGLEAMSFSNFGSQLVGWTSELNDSGVGEFSAGVSSYYRGLARCMMGGCRDQRVAQAFSGLANELEDNPALQQCLRQLVIDAAQENAATLAGRLSASAATSAVVTAASRRTGSKWVTRGSAVTVGPASSTAAAFGDLSYTIENRGDPTPSEMAQAILLGGIVAPELACECLEHFSN